MISTNAGPFARRVLLAGLLIVKFAVLLSGAENRGVVFMLLILTSIWRTEVLGSTLTFTVKSLGAVTASPWLSPTTEIVGGAGIGLVGSKTMRMIRLAGAVCPALTITLWKLLGAIPGFL